MAPTFLSRRSLLVALIFAQGGCTVQRDSLDEISVEELPRLQGRFAVQEDAERLNAVEAYVGDTDFFVSYKTGGKLIYAGGNWSDRIDLSTAERGNEEAYAGPYLLPLQYRQSVPWDRLPESPIVPALLSDKQWQRFREQLFAAILPRDERHGVIMHFANDDYFFYYNEDNKFESRLLIDKPANYAVSERFSFGEFMQRGLPQLGSFLVGEGVSNRRIVFSTGDTGAYALPFLYVNLDLPIAVFVRSERASMREPADPNSSQMIRSVGRVAHSHLGGLVFRPLSGVFKLLFVATEAAAETVRPQSLASLERTPIPEITDGPAMDLASWERRVDDLTSRKATSGTIRYLIDGEEFFSRLIDVLTSARESILLRSYIFDNDDFAETIGQLLRRRSNEGLDVRVLLDGFGTILAAGTQHESMPEDYVPPVSIRAFLESDSNINVRLVNNPWLVAGDHVKATIIDDEIAFTGGMNIGREYRYVWHDMMMELQGPVVDILTNNFSNAWSHAGMFGDLGYFFHKLRPNRNRDRLGGQSMRVLFTNPGNAEIFRVQREAIRSSQRFIFIESAYFADDSMLYELAKARRRGVDVRVILPLIANHGMMNQSNALAANAMLEHGIRVFLYPGMSHVKAAVFDGWACLGSANWDNLSFHTNKELNIATSDTQAVDDLMARLFAADFQKSVEMTEPFPERWSDHLAELLVDYLF